MKRMVLAGFVLVVLVEAWAVVLRDTIGWAVGAALALLLFAVRWSLRDDDRAADRQPPADDAGELLAQWLTETGTLIRRADSTRLQWDRHLRPRLAREFASATGHRQATDPAAFHATGRMLFGEQLWQWVDPDNVASAAERDGPAPGRAVLDEILQRLERL